MQQLAEILHYYKLDSPASVPSIVSTASDIKVGEISTAITGAIEYDEEHLENISANILDPFRFLASSSVTGRSGCNATDCRLAKAEVFARYAALYCDEVFVPINISRGHGAKHARESLRIAAIILSTSLPLIEAGIVRPVIPSLCRQCFDNAPDLVAIRSMADSLAEQHARDFRIYIVGKHKGKAAVRLEGPSDIIEHGRTFVLFDRVPDWYPEELPEGEDLERGLALDHLQFPSSQSVFKRIYRTIAMDVIAQILFDKHSNGGLGYLTGMPGEIEFLSSVKQERETALRTAAVAERLTHEVPVFSDAPIESIVELRRQQRDAFVLYRSALKEIIRNHLAAGGGISEDDAKQIYGDILAPRLAKLAIEAEATRRLLRRRALVKAAASTAILTVGLIGGVFPAQISELLKAVGGFSIARDIVESVVGVTETAVDVRRSDLYFLLRLGESATS